MSGDATTRTTVAAATGRAMSRRRLIRLAAGGAGVLFVGCRGSAGHAPDGAVIDGGDAGVEGNAPAAEASPAAWAPSARELGFDTDLPLTPNADFYVMKRGLVPEMLEDDHLLTFDGLVTNQLELGLRDIRGLPQHTLMRTLECIGNRPDGDLIGNAVWTGVRFRDVLALAAPLDQGTELVLRAADGYHTGVPMVLAADPQSYLVWAMNGVPLLPEHGFPIRCLFPGRYGQKQPKWLTTITVQKERHLGYYERQGWSDEAVIVTKSRIDTPGHRRTVSAPIEIGGIAFADRSGVARVEVLVDDEPAGEAPLIQAPAPHASLCWTVWHWTWTDPEPGNHVLTARATDGNGRSQARERRSLLGGELKEGRSEMHRVSVLVEG